jgi:Na+-driven multidrug efflux pump
VWVAFIVDEWLRGIIMYFRWRSRVWEKKVLVVKAEAASY